MKRTNCISCVLVIAVFAGSSTRVDAALPVVAFGLSALKQAALGFAGGAGQAVGEGVVSPLFNGEGRAVPESIRRHLRPLESVAGEHARAIQILAESVDERTTRDEFVAAISKVESLVYAHEARLQAHAVQVAKINKRLASAEATGREHQEFLRYLDESHRKLKAELAEAVDGLQVELAELRASVSDLQLKLGAESAERKQADQELSDRLSHIEELISPETRRKTASMLGASGALVLVQNGDPNDAVRTLQLAIAYDTVANRHVDPGSKYYLAVAYRRLGRLPLAEQTLSEAIVAERYRSLPEWYENVTERFQNKDRLWMENARRDYVYGVRSPHVPMRAPLNTP